MLSTNALADTVVSLVQMLMKNSYRQILRFSLNECSQIMLWQALGRNKIDLVRISSIAKDTRLKQLMSWKKTHPTYRDLP